MKTSRTLILMTILAIGMGCGYSKKANTPPAPGTTPTISALNPASQAAGSAAFMLEVDGSNFSSNAVINFNGAPMTTTWTNAGKVSATIPSTAIMTAGMVPVTVTNPGTAGGIYGGGTAAATSTPMNFTIN